MILCITYQNWIHKRRSGVKGNLYSASPSSLHKSCKAPNTNEEKNEQ